MDLEQVKKRIQDIKDCSEDFEGAHSMEDSLHQDVLEHIANGGDNAQELALEALKTTQIQFARYCA